jgi:GNAT superfamily N-acetyltransferase
MLIAELDDRLRSDNPGSPVNGIEVEAFRQEDGMFAIGLLDDEAVCCGAIRRYEEAAEVKRMFVRSRFRREGIGRSLLRFLEDQAVGRGYKMGLLETSVNQHAAIALYEAEAWVRTPAFGSYVGNSVSVCFKKDLNFR